MSRIVFLLTTTPWDDRRQFHRQAPALVQGGNEVLYISGQPNRNVETSFKVVPLTEREHKKARRYGALNCYNKITKLAPDVIQLCSIEQLPLGIFLKLTTDIKVVYDCREDMASAMLWHKPQYSKLVRWGLHYMTRFVEYLATILFDGLILADPGVYKKHSAMPKARKMIFFNTAQLRDFSLDYLPLSDREYDVLMLGSMNSRTGVMDIIAAVGQLKKQDINIKVLFVGEVEKKIAQFMSDEIERYGIGEQVEITGRIPHMDVPKQLIKAKVGIVPLHDLKKFRSNIACKSFEYMACGIPCICSDLAPQHIFITEGVEGRFYPPGDVNALADLIVNMIKNIDDTQMMGNNARKAVEEKWNAEKFEGELRHFYDEITEKVQRKLF